MIVGCSRLELFFGESHSLKDKRQILKSIIERVKYRFNVSVVELDDHDLWQKSTIGISCVNRAEGQVKRTLNEVERFIENLNKAQVTHNELNFFSPEK
jgi:uncharacterized protein YlxP (DUF503 family)